MAPKKTKKKSPRANGASAPVPPTAPRHPHLFEANARLWLARWSAASRKPLTLATIPDRAWDELAERGFHHVWLMGLWRRSPRSAAESAKDAAIRAAMDAAWPGGWTPDMLGGSPYAVLDYSLDPSLGGPDDLAVVKEKLNRRGLGLVVDFIANHVAADHAWTKESPEVFVDADAATAAANPGRFFQVGRRWIAHGRDPHFQPWTDTAQINYMNEHARQAMIGELRRLAATADGVRCDMAMLVINRAFEKTWAGFLTEEDRLVKEFWPQAIYAARLENPKLLFMAESYWNLESELLGMGFDYAYDKVLYDRLLNSDAAHVRQHLAADRHYQSHLAHFIENHDEGRAAGVFGEKRSRAFAVAYMTLPGMRIVHDGQDEGRKVKPPVQALALPAEEPQALTKNLYDTLYSITQDPCFHAGEWEPLQVEKAWDGNCSDDRLLAWSWTFEDDRRIVVVNAGAAAAQGYVRLPKLPGIQTELVFADILNHLEYEHSRDAIDRRGLYVDLAPWQSHVFAIR